MLGSLVLPLERTCPHHNTCLHQTRKVPKWPAVNNTKVLALYLYLYLFWDLVAACPRMGRSSLRPFSLHLQLLEGISEILSKEGKQLGDKKEIFQTQTLQLGQTNPLMFSTTPMTGRLTL